MYIFDEDSANDVYQENKVYNSWLQEQKNRILSAVWSSDKKQQKWNELYPKLALEGLSEEELNQPY